MVMKEFILQPDSVQDVWLKWLHYTGYFNNHLYAMYVGDTYNNNRTYKDFVKFLDTYGAYIHEERGKRYIKFLTPEQATFFILRWS